MGDQLNKEARAKQGAKQDTRLVNSFVDGLALLRESHEQYEAAKIQAKEAHLRIEQINKELLNNGTYDYKKNFPCFFDGVWFSVPEEKALDTNKKPKIELTEAALVLQEVPFAKPPANQEKPVSQITQLQTVVPEASGHFCRSCDRVFVARDAPTYPKCAECGASEDG